MKALSIPAICAAIFAIFLPGCKNSTEKAAAAQPPRTEAIGAFSADSAYANIKRQVAFGPRVPGTEAHDRCAEYLAATLRHYADSVYVQRGEVTAYTGEVLPISNIIAGFNLRQSRRILLAAHWDSRPWADKEDKSSNRNTPIEGANDGASGAAVLLEIARNLAMKKPDVGVDIILFDAEDYGNSDFLADTSDTWCLGSQYWADNMVPYRPENLPIYGILLDMVGGRGARFHYEDFALRHSPTPTIKVWSEAAALGYGTRFISSVGGAVMDDHVVLTRAGIPTTDIIELNNRETNSFPATWHTQADRIENISRRALDDVGKTVLNVVYKEKAY